MTRPHRPVKEYALARVTMQERLDRLTSRERQAVILHAAGYRMADIAEVLGYGGKQSIQYLFSRGLSLVKD